MFVLRSFRRRLKVLAALLILTVAALPGALVASDCTVLLDTGGTRKCTFTEQLGGCLSGAYDSWKSCRADHGFLLGWTVCQLALTADVLACGVETPFQRIIRK